MKNDSVITSRGQITVPKRLRDRFGLRPGMRVRFAASRQGVLVQKEERAKSVLRRAYGVVRDGVATDAYLRTIRGSVK
ncbi:MAG: AbrB/MazE/SpoVT family DNA-binding domain-containing protein [Deltaproteobacteria bacterium]|nr:AbrB/MazE/SpoVT family DNA-binding domain-containing protein [Deltaproteobacteria bacterium]